MLCKTIGVWQRPIDFFEALVAEHPEALALHLNLALSNVDAIADPKLAVVGQGLLSNKSIQQLDIVLDADPESWPALYCRAMNHLHWPRALRHAPHAIRDFEALLALQARAPEPQPYFVLAHIGLGDAHVKNRDLEQARAVWQEAARRFPGNQELRRRLAMGDAELEAFIEKARGLDIVIDTNLNFLWEPVDEARLGFVDVASAGEGGGRPLIGRGTWLPVLLVVVVGTGIVLLVVAALRRRPRYR